MEIEEILEKIDDWDDVKNITMIRDAKKLDEEHFVLIYGFAPGDLSQIYDLFGLLFTLERDVMAVECTEAFGYLEELGLVGFANAAYLTDSGLRLLSILKETSGSWLE